MSVPAGGGRFVLEPSWPAPPGVRAAFTLRNGGVSPAPYDTLNLGAHVGDDPRRVAENRARVRAALALPGEPHWLEQVHGTNVVEVAASRASMDAPADAVVVRKKEAVAAIQVADCLPVLFTARDASVVAAAHAGWRGLAGGVLEATLSRMETHPSEVLAWLGPAIGTSHFEVGHEVLAAFTARDPGDEAAFQRNDRGRWQCDLPQLARRRLQAAGVGAIYGGEWCTYAEPARFFSYRRDGRCGRMAALIWLA